MAFTPVFAEDLWFAIAADHYQRQHYFRPEVSRKNVGLWKTYENQDTMSYIAKELPDYCCKAQP